MRTLKYELLPPVGDGTLERSGSLEDLVLGIPYLLVSGLIPPLNVLNEVLKAGGVDAGMSGGCRWQPFEITPTEYDELVRSLTDDPARGFKSVDTPDWVKTDSDWTIWVMEIIRGVPSQQHRTLTEEYTRLERQYKEARDSGNSELAEALFVQSVEAGGRLSDFVMSHVTKDRNGRPDDGQ
jgi:hypothetical protein